MGSTVMPLFSFFRVGGYIIGELENCLFFDTHPDIWDLDRGIEID